uniref:Uncharacterized protein n=1 Tax=Rhizophora mucronata TaxID=61149 RepID=A0A2P2Q8H0_RHIMU
MIHVVKPQWFWHQGFVEYDGQKICFLHVPLFPMISRHAFNHQMGGSSLC